MLLVFAAIGSHPPSAAECSVCTTVVTAIDRFAVNSTSVAALAAILDADCAKVFPSSPKLATGCETLANASLKLLPTIAKGLDSVAWDATALCAGLGACDVPCCDVAHPTAPEQIHLALVGDNAGGMSVMWSTLHSVTDASVQYGLSPAALSASSPALNSTYTTFSWRGVLYTAAMSSLKASTTYYYRVGSEAAGWSAVSSFRTLAANAGSDASPLRIAMVADMGYGNLSDGSVARLTALAESGAIDLVLHNGDVGE
jgi:hypothetical protein